MEVDFSQPQILAAGVAAVVSLLIGVLTIVLNAWTTAWKLREERRRYAKEKAWADYELRRDTYIEIARRIDCLFEGGRQEDRPEFHKAVRTLRIVGSDEVVQALNDLTAGVREGGGNHDQRYRALFNALRRDIREFHALPEQGTSLGPDAFPIES